MNSENNIRRYFLRPEETVEDKFPRHYLDTKTFKIWTTSPDTVSKHGRFSFKWSRSGKLTNGYGYSFWTEISTFISMDEGNTWIPFANCHYLGEATRNGGLAHQIHDELIELRDSFKKERIKRLAKERREQVKMVQTKLGISQKEAQEVVSNQRLKEQRNKATKADVERTKRIISVAPLIRDLKNEVDSILKQLEEDPSKVYPTHVPRGKRDIKLVTSILRHWNRK